MAKKSIKDMRKILDRYAVEYEIDATKTHTKVTVKVSGRSRKLSVSSSPSCPHALNQFERDLKKVITELRDGLNPGAMWAKN